MVEIPVIRAVLSTRSMAFVDNSLGIQTDHTLRDFPLAIGSPYYVHTSGYVATLRVRSPFGFSIEIW
jgi:hypothetical protein